jgi:hypothetical protein
MRVRNADDGRHQHRGVLREGRLHLDSIDIEAAGDDHVLLAIDDEQVAAVVKIAKIAREPEPVLELGRGSLRIVEVAAYGCAGAQADFAGFAHRQRIALDVADGQLDAWRDAPG